MTAATDHKHLEKQITETAAVVTDWKGSIAKMEHQLGVAGEALAKAKKHREVHALKASLGDATAITAVKHARAEQHTAEQDIDDLKIALPEAEAQLAEAEKSATQARQALAKHHAQKIMRSRVEAAARMDGAFAEATAAYADFERLGRELQSFPDLNFGSSGNTSYWENIAGFRRIAAALPTFFVKLFPPSWKNEDARRPLAEAEAHFWQLPPETGAAKAA
jgi:hypothetical protein